MLLLSSKATVGLVVMPVGNGPHYCGYLITTFS